MSRPKIAVIGIGKIAVDQHLPVIGKSPDFELAATVSGRGIAHEGLPVFRTPAELYEAMPAVDVVAVCTPPASRHAIVREALAAGRDVLMEKPPMPTLSEFDDLVREAERQGRVLFQTWHSQYNAAVDEARRLLAEEGVARLRIDWRESVRKWHPGQDWVWEPGGFGVFDPGINALSILSKIMPFPIFVEAARLAFPANRQAPIDAAIRFKSNEAHRPEISAGFNWLEESDEVWRFTIETGRGRGLVLEKGGTALRSGGETLIEAPSEEYERIYKRFAALLSARRSEVEGAPLRWTSDAFLLGARETVGDFEW